MAGEPADKIAVVLITGPTGIGKTALAVQIAGRIGGEIVNADSRQIYRYMDIGTAKPTPAERAATPHHLIDIVDPDVVLTMSEYQGMAYAAIDDIARRGKIPLLVGGTGQYIMAVLEGWSAPEVAPNPELRADLAAFAAEHGTQALFDQLRTLDPVATTWIDAHNTRRIIRALEVCITTGEPFSAQRRKFPPPYRVLELGLTMEREALYTRLEARIDQMMADGLLDEVIALRKRGYAWKLPSMSGLGYLQLGMYMRGEATLEEAVILIKRDTRTFVRHQYTWFRRRKALIWLEGVSFEAAYARIIEWL